MKPRSAEVSTGDSNKYSDGASVDDEFLGDSDTADEKQPPNPKTAAGGVGQLELPRLVRRNRPYSQSGNRLKVEHNQGFKVFLLLRHDWFHVILRLPTERSLLCLLTVWTALVLIFASLYVAVDNHDPNVSCGLGPVGSPIDFGGAFSFSLETCTTGTFG